MASKIPRNIEHPDLSQMGDTELAHEHNYYRWNIPEILDWIYSHAESYVLQPKQTGNLPHRKIVADLYFAMDRLQAISEEIVFRATSMR